MFLPLILLFLLQIDHRLLDCCIIAIILKQFPLCDSKGIQGACTFKVNCNHCAGIIKKCSTSTENIITGNNGSIRSRVWPFLWVPKEAKKKYI